MIIAQNFAAKLTVAFVAIAMMLTAVAPAQAQTADELQAQIAELMATINSLQSQVGQGGTSVASGICPYAWTRSLSQGSTGDDVMKLQQFLNGSEDTRVSASGAGSVGAETMYYGPATAAAVSKFQVKYRAEILSPGGLVNPTGYFGPASMAQANMLCSGASPVDPGEEGEEGEEEEEESEELSGEGTLETFEVDNASDTDIQEGAEDEVIAELTLEASDGDIEIDRMDVVLETTGSDDPWDVFEEISLWVDGEKVASVTADDEDEYLDEDEGSLRFSGLGLVLREDEEVEVLVGATVQGSVDDVPADWTLGVDEVRFFDADGVADDDGSTDELGNDGGEKAEFEIVEEGDGEELKFSLGTGNPDSTDIVVDEDDTTDGVTILEYELEAEGGDIEINELWVRLITTTEDVGSVVDEVMLEIDGSSFDAEATSTGSTTVDFEFDIDGDVVIDEDDTVTVKVIVDFKSTDSGSNYDNGETIQAVVNGAMVDLTDAEGSDDITAATPDELSGTASGDAHTLVAEGIVVPVDGVEATTDTSGENDTLGEFTIEFEVTAIEGDFYIAENAALSATTGVQYSVDGTSATTTGTLSSTADEDTAGVFTVREGETEIFTLFVTVDPDASGNFRVTLTEVNYTADEAGVTNTEAYLPTPAQDFRTGYETVQGATS